MARIENSTVKESSGGYQRIFGNKALGVLISRIQSTVISAGSELERIILDRVNTIDNLKLFLEKPIMPEGVFVANKKEVRNCPILDHSYASEPDFVVFRRRGNKQSCHVIELKDGHIFDTKKARIEHRTIRNFIERNGPRIQYTVNGYICCFNQDDPEAIVAGFKNQISADEALTGRQFCKLLAIDYDKIVHERKKDQSKNVNFFVKELLKIPAIRNRIEKNLGG